MNANKPVYTITASHSIERRTVNASSPEQALDIIDDFSAAGFKVDVVIDNEGQQIDPMDILHRLLAEG